MTNIPWLLLAITIPGLVQSSTQPGQSHLDFERNLLEYVWFDNYLADYMWDREGNFRAVVNAPYMLSDALKTRLKSPEEKIANKMKVPKPRIRLG